MTTSIKDKLVSIFVPRHTAKPVDYPGRVVPVVYFRCEHVFDELKKDSEARPQISSLAKIYKGRHAKTHKEIDINNLLLCRRCQMIWNNSGLLPGLLGPLVMYYCEVDHVDNTNN